VWGVDCIVLTLSSICQVCGNTAAVDGLNTWLANWQAKITGQFSKADCANNGNEADRDAGYDSDQGWSEADSDVDSGDDDDSGLQNTLLVTGPEGVSS
jgi:hypothetical protein